MAPIILESPSAGHRAPSLKSSSGAKEVSCWHLQAMQRQPSHWTLNAVTAWNGSWKLRLPPLQSAPSEPPPSSKGWEARKALGDCNAWKATRSSCLPGLDAVTMTLHIAAQALRLTACKKLGMCHSCRSVTQNLGFQQESAEVLFLSSAFEAQPMFLSPCDHAPDSHRGQHASNSMSRSRNWRSTFSVFRDQIDPRTLLLRTAFSGLRAHKKTADLCTAELPELAPSTPARPKRPACSFGAPSAWEGSGSCCMGFRRKGQLASDCHRGDSFREALRAPAWRRSRRRFGLQPGGKQHLTIELLGGTPSGPSHYVSLVPVVPNSYEESFFWKAQ